MHLEVGIVDTDQNLSRLPLAGEVPMGEHGAIEILRFIVQQVFRRHPGEILAGEDLRQRRNVGGQALSNGGDNFVDE